jgi:16S rRNA (cytosine967-C5)-methyltransferase
MSPRLSAIKILQKIIQQKSSLSDINFEQPLTQEIVYGTLRWYGWLEHLLKQLLKQPVKTTDFDVQLLMIIGLYQLTYLHLPEYAVVNESVAVTQQLKKPWAKNLVNAILREYIRQKDKLLAKNDSAQLSHPAWMIKKIQSAWPTYWQDIFTANNQHPPFSLRVNLLKATREEYLPAELHQHTSSGITLPAQPIKQLTGFTAGKISVQDGAAQLAAHLLEVLPENVVLDACAAPGGKTGHIIETQPLLKKLIALDIDPQRLHRVTENLHRLGNHDKAQYLPGDASDPASWWDGILFDRILLDAPCSATGVIRRHPDIKFLRLANDIEKLTVKQSALLTALWPLLKPGGLLVYATCSIFPEENTEIIAKFLRTHLDAQEKIIHAAWGITQAHGRQILPGMDNLDGFYYARLQKISNA